MERFCVTILASAIAMYSASLAAQETASDEDVVELDTFVAEEEVNDDLGILQSEPVDSVFGFGKTILETPRSVSSISSEFLDQFNAKGINDIVNFVPGTFTTSFFGVAGSLDIRGTAAENYFRGVKRLNNEGNFPTPIGASDRIDVIRGPMSPISGPSKVGGALNFIPKSARASTGQYMEDSTGEISYETGSWDRNIMKAELGGPAKFLGDDAGYYLYGEINNSDSYYKNDFTEQTLLQASFNKDLSAKTRIEFGGMYQDWRGHENGGWNRVTQDLIDNGTYITGIPATNIDSEFGNGDGLINEPEIDLWETTLAGLVSTGEPFTPGTVSCFTGLVPFCFNGNFEPLDPSMITQDLVDGLGIGLDPATVGTTKLSGNEVLISKLDEYDTEASTFYFDIIHDFDNGWSITNKLFYDAQEYTNVDSYGFTKIADAWVIEDQLIFAKTFEFNNWTSALQLSPSIRYTDAFYALDFGHEIFDRTDLSQGFNALSIQQVPSRLPPGAESWSDYWNSEYTQYGLAAMVDMNFFENLNVLLGGRWDYVDAEGENGDGDGPIILRTFDPDGEHSASNSDDGFTYTASVSYTIAEKFTPYITRAEQQTIVSGSAGDLDTENIKNKTFLGESELDEFGLKMSLLDGRLYMAGAYYEQQRIAFSSQNPVSNQAVESEGYELEFRYVPFDDLALIGTYSNQETRVTTPGGVTFSYIGAADMPQVDPSAVYGGIIGGNIVVGEKPLRGGIPEVTWSLSASYKLMQNVKTNLSVTYVDEVESSVLGGITLPDYYLVNGSVVYDSEKFRFGVFLNNILDEDYYRGNFPSLYGNNAVLPELPFNWSAEIAYKF
ncbi:TonB-dependent receptor [Mangrovimicrobium sediminis]|uniref:TonB-dependent receptor n=1 Tax=Mangrovimicrobium sediminis TaxID=2562682 RepID=A0A4Z0M5K3_9GAMM|nr:TonB-dependent receptor [Haliea sp. SAOS-164]TGD74585.1 TonB-dependent receptor [Haliea sp. SAOS-164]